MNIGRLIIEFKENAKKKTKTFKNLKKLTFNRKSCPTNKEKLPCLPLKITGLKAITSPSWIRYKITLCDRSVHTTLSPPRRQCSLFYDVIVILTAHTLFPPGHVAVVVRSHMNGLLPFERDNLIGACRVSRVNYRGSRVNCRGSRILSRVRNILKNI